jgi:transcriptional regulator with XRE-family HTH domain
MARPQPVRVHSQRQIIALMRRLRFDSGLSVPEVADDLGISRSLAYYRDRGDRPYSLEALVDAAALYGYDLVLQPRPNRARRAA